MDKPTKPSNLMPRSFGGVKNNWSASMQTNGYEDGVPAIYGGDNLNYQLDATGKELDYCEKIVDFINDIPIGKTITVDSNNKLVYDDLAQEVPIATTETAGIVKPDGETITITQDGTISANGSSRNIGEIVASTIPLTDAGLHLLDGALIDGSGSYSAFVEYIADLYNADPTASYFAQSGSYEEIWTQPILTSNGTMGGDSFACTQDKAELQSYAYKLFDGDNSTQWNTWSTSSPQTGTITIYNPVPLKITSIGIINYYNFSAIIVSGSDDNTNWTNISSTLTSNNLNQTLSLNNSNHYKYYKFVCSTSSQNIASYTWSINATYQVSLSPENWWQQQVSTYGVCGKFVYDSVNNTVRLPKITGFIEGTTDPTALGDLIQAGLPNITGSGESHNGSLRLMAGAFSTLSTGSSVPANTSGAFTEKFDFDASRSSSIYGNSHTVQPQAIKVLYYIVIATTTKTDIQVDIDEIATDLNGKADVDFGNVNNTNNIAATHLNTAGIRTVIETYVNGTSWYRVYSDGWCEQGGRSSGATGRVVSLLKHYANTNYIVLTTGHTNSNASWWGDYSGLPFNLTTSQFQIATVDSDRPVFWQASGYIR
jgi:hypothetical protein